MNGTGAAMRHGFAVCVGGISGVGKTTLLQQHVAGEPRDQQVTGSSVIRQIIAPDGFEALDRWPPARREQVREESIARLVAMRAACPGRLLIDGHFTLRNRGTGALESVFTPGDRGFYQALVLVDAAARTRDDLPGDAAAIRIAAASPQLPTRCWLNERIAPSTPGMPQLDGWLIQPRRLRHRTATL